MALPADGKGNSTIGDLVKEARALTGKPARSSDDTFVAWMEGQEVTAAVDFFNLSEEGLATVARAPDASVVLMDAMRQLRSTAVSKAAASCPAPANAPRSQMVDIKVHGHIGTITMDNGRKRNALNHELCRAVGDGLDRCIAAGVRVVILRAQPGVKVWSAGHDMREFERLDGSSADSGRGSFAEPLSRKDTFVQLLEKIRLLETPVIGAIEGTVWGGACDVCACCDVLVGTPDVSFAITPAKIGLPYNSSGMAHFLGAIPLHVTKWMFFSGTPLTAEEALRYGFLNAIVPPEQLTEKVQSMAGIIASRAPLVVSLLKKQLTALCSAPSLTPEIFEELHERRKTAWRSSDMEEGISAFFQKREANFKGI